MDDEIGTRALDTITVELTRERARYLLAGVEQDVNMHAYWADASSMECRRQKHANIAKTYSDVAEQLMRKVEAA